MQLLRCLVMMFAILATLSSPVSARADCSSRSEVWHHVGSRSHEAIDVDARHHHHGDHRSHSADNCCEQMCCAPNIIVTEPATVAAPISSFAQRHHPTADASIEGWQLPRLNRPPIRV